MNLGSFNSKPVYFTIALGVLVMCWDFFGRVWYPMNHNLAGDTEQGVMSETGVWAFAATPEYLDNWINQEQRQANNTTTEMSEEEIARRKEAERERRLRPMAGSTELEGIRIRVRAIFKHTGDNERELALAIAEAQTIETGNVERIVLNQGETVGGYLIREVNADAVFLTRDESEQIKLRVFEFN